MFKKHPNAPCAVTKVRLTCGDTTTLTTALGVGIPDADADALAGRQVEQHWPGAEVKSTRIYR